MNDVAFSSLKARNKSSVSSEFMFWLFVISVRKQTHGFRNIWFAMFVFEEYCIVTVDNVNTKSNL